MRSWTSLSLTQDHALLAQGGAAAREVLCEWSAAPSLLGLETHQWVDTLRDDRSVLRSAKPTHVSTSAVVFCRDLLEPRAPLLALLLWHLKAQEWVYPGGHADGDWNLLRSAVREVAEETGLTGRMTLHHDEGVPAAVPALVQRIDVGGHAHYDAVFFLEYPWECRMGATFDATESADLRWWPVSEGVEHEQEIPAITRAALTQLWHSCGGAHVAS